MSTCSKTVQLRNKYIEICVSEYMDENALVWWTQDESGSDLDTLIGDAPALICTPAAFSRIILDCDNQAFAA